MRKCWWIVAFMLMVISGTAVAQDSTASDYELDQTLVVPTLDFTLDYPNGWVQDISERISIAENEDDLAAMIDDDDTTQPAGYSLTLSSIPKSDIAELVSIDDPTLDDVVAFVGSSIQIDSQFDLPIMARRAATLAGVNGLGEYGIGSIWEMDETYVSLGMGTAEDQISDEFMALYEAITASIKPVSEEPIELSEEPYVLGDLSIPYPAAWTAEASMWATFSGAGFFADPTDFESMNTTNTIKEAVILVMSGNGMGMDGWTGRQSVEQIFVPLMTEVGNEGEFLVGDALGYGFSGMTSFGYMYIVSMATVDHIWMFYGLAAADRETGEAAIPFFINTLQGVEALSES